MTLAWSRPERRHALRPRSPKLVPVSGFPTSSTPADLQTSKGAECKRHKIRCEFRPGESTCTKCIRSGIKCVVNDFSQKFVDDDGMYALPPAPGGVPPLNRNANRSPRLDGKTRQMRQCTSCRQRCRICCARAGCLSSQPTRPGTRSTDPVPRRRITPTGPRSIGPKHKPVTRRALAS